MMLTQVQGFGGDEAAHPHRHPQEGEEGRPGFGIQVPVEKLAHSG